MKFLFKILIIILLFFSFTSVVFAQKSYTISEIKDHDNPSDCWMSINGKVYNLTTYLEDHDKELDIRSWCGTDATLDYTDKAGKGKSHSNRADNLLSSYIIGDLVIKEAKSNESQSNATKEEMNTVNVKGSNNYNLLIPLFGTIFLYLISLKFLKRQTHYMIWNIVLLIGLIPALGFGIIMILATKFSWAYSLKHPQMLYYHVEFSIIFGTTCLLHFLNRIRVFISQGKNTLGK